MNSEDIIRKAEEFARIAMKDYDGGHDWQHIERVRKLAGHINGVEKIADPFILDVAAILHDCADSKFNSIQNAYDGIKDFLDSVELSLEKDHILNAIKNVSFSNKNPSGELRDPVLLVLQDADRLDAIGAVGVARAFSYGGFRNNPVYIPPDETGKLPPSTISHFYEKLLKLKDLMNTSGGRQLAEERHRFLEIFLERFYREIGDQ
jgi:uncharacterized protein